jgi:Domain of unknown function (DUF5103)
MTKSIFIVLISFFCVLPIYAQIETEFVPPYHIKTVTFVQNRQTATPVFRLGDSFELQFDDLYGNEANYYYTITHCDYDWKKSDLSQVEYIKGFDDQRIQQYTNSFNTLQLYSHYVVSFPNRFTSFLVSGNYMIKILNEDKEVVFSRKFMLFEDMVQVPMQIKRARNVKDIEYKQNLDFAIKSKDILFQNPLRNVKVFLFQNSQINQGVSNIKPMYTIGNDLIYKYDKETQFWGGNEFLFLETKDVRGSNNTVSRTDSQGGVYNSHLYTHNARCKNPYTFFPDINGNFIVNNINAEQNEVEADYTWVFFSLSAPAYFGKSDVYINGKFNNFALSDENKMEYNKEKGIYEKAIMIKQGFTNYQYVLADKAGKIDYENSLDGNYYQTENNYFALVYYRENNQRYDRIIGKGIATSVDITN